MKRGFTLIEVTLAMMIMAGGVLAMVSLYSLGFRENTQSREDVAGAALADAVMGPLIMAASATNLQWSVYRQEFSFPNANGWEAYFNSSTGVVTSDPEPIAENVFNQAMARFSAAAQGELDAVTAFPSAARSESKLSCGLVVLHAKDSPIVKIAFRATPKPGLLLAMPIYYTEVRFQGDPTK